jgi:hypothetical protein
MRNASLLSLPQPGLRDLLVLVGTLIAALVAIQVGCGSQARWRKQADAAKGSGSSQRETEGAGEGPAVEKTATSEALQQGLLVAAIARNVHLREGLRGK